MGVRPRRIVAVAGPALVLAIAAACRQIVGIGDQPPTDFARDAAVVEASARDGAPDAGPDGVVYAGAACESCLQNNCGVESAACAADPACAPLEGCLGGCDGGNLTCRAGCYEAHRIDPNQADIQLSACLANHCESPCGLECGGITATLGVDAAAGCQTCVVQEGACSAGETCASDPQCIGRFWCATTNPFLDRAQACAATLDAGADAFSAISGVAGGACHDSCGLGQQWFCVGLGLPTQPQGPGTALTVAVIDYELPSNVDVDASVAVCSPSDWTCPADASPLSSGMTGANGEVTLTVPNSGAIYGPFGYLDISGGSLQHEVYYWGFPLSEPAMSAGVGTLTVGEVQEAVTLVESQGVPVDTDDHAFALVQASDCTLAHAENVRISISGGDPDAGARVIYQQGETLSVTATQTDSSGRAAIVNIPGDTLVNITASPLPLGGKPSSVVTVYAPKGTFLNVQAPVNQ